MSFTKSILSSLSKYADFTGRASKSEYWYFQLFALILFITTFALALLVKPFLILQLVITISLMLPLSAVAVRRAHDADKSGWVLLIPFYSGLVQYLPSVEHDNRYGPYVR